MTADQWRRLEALGQPCLGCLNEDIHDAESQRDRFELWKRIRASVDKVLVEHGKEPPPQLSEKERAEAEQDGRLQTEQAIATLKQLEPRRRRLLTTVRKTRVRPSCPRCTPRRKSREEIARLAARISQVQRDRAAEDALDRLEDTEDNLP